ncbi:hypothetical protein COY93_03535 [Candidatus Uhrbacteria bacterium CG_4_10_14_0_8_um_filter_58_22]|uniref:ABC transporter domain-containing protein n=1 Tax=Candidatus Uhrbacteria bacterium CG_4_10_14_0_8_um_filter_58_22 TaxID=1975029 RepID=A0A2M7Q9H4_9BACT|nr:MAG: hypothetical protein AUJ19_04370 [Parcubacteria group bacterium CG1_02_58_44]PIY62214.1 MAG: hypothetical protein COY93_03535 [Candidatus Uhrbacteria bacterium CG_4_10_14_0_8_um_filter_58_22]
MLAGRNLTKRHDGTEVLKDIDIAVGSGQIVSLIGPSGAGKTTLLRALSMLDQPESGNVTLDDERYDFPLRADKKISPWPKISVVF